MLRRSTQEILDLIEMGMQIKPGIRWFGEPGAVGVDARLWLAAEQANSGRPVHWHKPLQDYLTRYTSKFFRTEKPNLDIRHGSNFTGPKTRQEPHV